MGCGGSRFDKRKDNAYDLFTLPLQFIGGEGADDDGCPVDKVVFSFAKGEKEPGSVYEVDKFVAKSEEAMKEIATSTYQAVSAQLQYLEKEYGKPSADAKKEYVIGGKYTLEQAHKQLSAVLASLKENSGFTFEEVKAEEPKAEGEAEKKEGEEPKMEEGEAAMMEGGEEGAAMMGMEEPDLYAGDSADYKGFANFPLLLLKEMTVNPYFGELVKTDTIHFEFAAVKKGGFSFPTLDVINPMALLKKGATPGAFAGAAGLVSSCVNLCEAEEKEVFFAGFAGEQDFETLKEIAEKKDKIMFPGVMAGWDSEEKALKSIEGFEGKSNQKLTKILYKVKTKVFSAVVCRQFVTRLRATIQTQNEKDGVTYFLLEEQKGEAKTVEQWIKERDAPPAPAEEPKKEGEAEKKEGEGEGEKKEGETAMEGAMEGAM